MGHTNLSLAYDAMALEADGHHDEAAALRRSLPSANAEYRLTHHLAGAVHPVKTIVRGATRMYREKDYYKTIGYTLVCVEFRNARAQDWQSIAITEND